MPKIGSRDTIIELMKQNFHPQYEPMTVTCACGNSFTVGGTRKSLHVDVCDKCHPFFTGTQKFVDIKGRVDKFMAKRAAAAGYTKKDKRKSTEDKDPVTLKEMLELQKKNLKTQEAATAE